VRVLLDTHCLIWLVEGAPLETRALFDIAKAQSTRELFVSPISAWEVGLAALKQPPTKRPNLLGLAPDLWWRRSTRKVGAHILPISNAIASEAAIVPSIYGYGDPGDCFLIATARVNDLTLITRDGPISGLSKRLPNYIRTLPC